MGQQQVQSPGIPNLQMQFPFVVAMNNSWQKYRSWECAQRCSFQLMAGA
jgi:hypothetical protein